MLGGSGPPACPQAAMGLCGTVTLGVGPCDKWCSVRGRVQCQGQAVLPHTAPCHVPHPPRAMCYVPCIMCHIHHVPCAMCHTHCAPWATSHHVPYVSSHVPCATSTVCPVPHPIAMGHIRRVPDVTSHRVPAAMSPPTPCHVPLCASLPHHDVPLPTLCQHHVSPHAICHIPPCAMCHISQCATQHPVPWHTMSSSHSVPLCATPHPTLCQLPPDAAIPRHPKGHAAVPHPKPHIAHPITSFVSFVPPRCPTLRPLCFPPSSSS